ncbi:TPA: hypothetical protein N0F65_000338 [Lagenidium giganteum]|uniref:PiggyBac transposable element-derived protein domain-containing protein n=1 Tax=Lagenidium giganteum TaxID=4803 RepID=A0AAV2YIB7_9STRA|nr:TPA: hypothetical protein N0F65_000338 [Lagenidium giganteum]
MRIYLKDKLHKWGTKMFLTCCAESVYCFRLELYCGRNSRSNTAHLMLKPAQLQSFAT